MTDAAPEPDAHRESTEASEPNKPILSGGSIVVGSLSRLISVAVLIVVIVAIGILFYRVMVGFFVPLFLAALLVVIFRPVHNYFTRRLGDRLRVAALLTTTVIFMIVLLPAALVLTVAAQQGTRILSGVNSQSLALALGRARETFGLSVTDPEIFKLLDRTIDDLADTSSFTETRMRIAQLESLERRLREDYSQLPSMKPLAFDEFEAALRDFAKSARDLEQAALSDQTPASLPPAALGEAPELPPAGERNATGGGSLPETIASAREGEGDELPKISQWNLWQDYQRGLVELDRAANELKAELLGGTFRAEVRMLAHPSDEDIQAALIRGREYLQARLPSLASATTEWAIHIALGLIVLVIAVYFFLLDGPTMTRTMMRLSPLDDAYEEKLLLEFDRTSRAIVLATILSALAQGVFAALGYYLADMQSVVLLFIATTFMALIPFLGAMAVWLPCVLWLGFVDQRWTAAILLGIWGALAVSTIDNVIKVFVLHGRSQLHPLLALLSVLGGVQVFGPVGLLIGPMVVVFLQTLLEILHQELMRDDANVEAKVSSELANE